MTNFITLVAWITWATNQTTPPSGLYLTNVTVKQQITANVLGIGPANFTNEVPVATNVFRSVWIPVEAPNRIPRAPLQVQDESYINGILLRDVVTNLSGFNLGASGAWRPVHTFRPKWKSP